MTSASTPGSPTRSRTRGAASTAVSILLALPFGVALWWVTATWMHLLASAMVVPADAETIAGSPLTLGACLLAAAGSGLLWRWEIHHQRRLLHTAPLEPPAT